MSTCSSPRPAAGRTAARASVRRPPPSPGADVNRGLIAIWNRCGFWRGGRAAMAIVAIFSGPGMHKQDYDALGREIGWEPHHPHGGIFHAASFDDPGDGHVVDVWES